MRSSSEKALETLRAAGYRLTTARKAVAETLAEAKAPLSAPEILRALAKARVPVDRATVYRELDVLAKTGIAAAVRFEGRAVRYELSDQAHHHHAVCIKCDAVEDVEADAAFEAAERRIAKRAGFKMLRHAFELFGLCKNCH